MQGHHRKDLQPDDVGREKCRRHSKNKPMLNALITALIVIIGLIFVAWAIYSPMSIVLILGVLGGIGFVRFTYLTVKYYRAR
jgi:fatty acid desaturase